VYITALSAAQRKLRQTKEDWRASKAMELQYAAHWGDMKAFYDGLKVAYSPRDSGSIPVRSHDGTTLITDHAGILSHWAEHFMVYSIRTLHFTCQYCHARLPSNNLSHSSSGTQKRIAENSNYPRRHMLPMPNLWTNMCVKNWAVLPLSNASTLTTIWDPSCRRPSPTTTVRDT